MRRRQRQRRSMRLKFFSLLMWTIFCTRFFPIVEVCINNQQTHNSNGLYAHEIYISIKFMWANSEYKGVLHCEGYDYEDFPDEIKEAPLSEPFVTKKMKMLSRTDGIMSYGKVQVDFFPFWIATCKYEN